MSLTGRNDPCPCGSKKKYKACCQQKGNQNSNEDSLERTKRQFASTANDPEWLKFRTAESEIDTILKKYIQNNFNNPIYKFAWDDFQRIDTLPQKAENYNSFFEYWMLYSWVIKHEFVPGATGFTLAELCLKKHPDLFTSYQKKLIKATVEAPFSFFLVQDIITDQRLFLKDILLHKEVEVKECSGTRGIPKGSIMFCRPTTLDGQSLIMGTAPYPLQNRFFDEVIALREDLRQTLETSILTPKNLVSYDKDIRDRYFELLREAFQPMKFANTDGEPIILNEIFYDLKCTPREAFDAINSLIPDSHTRTWEEGIFDDDNNFLEVDIPWRRLLDNTSLGNFTITSTELKVFVNSNKRADKALLEIEKCLGSKVLFRNKKTISMEDSDKLAKNSAKPGPAPKPMEPTPEMLKALKAHMDKHWIKWLDDEIPALGHQTPREAAKTKSGREKLEALFLDFENSNSYLVSPMEQCNRVDVDFLRKKLRLTD